MSIGDSKRLVEVRAARIREREAKFLDAKKFSILKEQIFGVVDVNSFQIENLVLFLLSCPSGRLKAAKFLHYMYDMGLSEALAYIDALVTQ